MKNCFCRKCASLFLIGVFLSFAFQPVGRVDTCRGTDIFSRDENPDTCYGLVIPLVYGENLPYTSIQQGITNFVNDLLRLNRSVFWSESNFSALTRTLINDSTQIRFFERGAFIVPFTQNRLANALILSIATDYAFESEIETHYPVSMFFLTEPISLDVIPLKYAKCALRFGLSFGFGDVFSFSDILYSSGFLDVHFSLDDEVCQKLNNNDYNLLIWPGGLNIRTASFFRDISVSNSKSIRDFVNNGGGYIGSCYGADAAASGPVVPMFILTTFLRNLPTYGFLALTSCSVLTVNCGGYVTISLLNLSHPVSFGLDAIQESFHIGGPVFTWATMNRNTQALGVLDDLQVRWWRDGVDKKVPQYILDRYLDFVKGKPIWITSQFGKGKVVAFGCHPEFHFPNRQDRVIDNAVFFVTSDDMTVIHLTTPVLFSDVLAVSTITNGIDLPSYQPVFIELWNIIRMVNTTSAIIDDALLNVIAHGYRISEVRGNEQGLITYSHDLYQRWLEFFSKALQKIECVYTLTRNTTSCSSTVSIWKNITTQELYAFDEFSRRLADNCTLLKDTIQGYGGSKVQRIRLLSMIDTVEILYREGYTRLNQLWSSTMKTCRNCWYLYERDLSLNASYCSVRPAISVVETDAMSSQNTLEQGNQMIYVDNDASVSGDGSIEHPYKHIQDAIDASCDGDTVFVHAGWYYENLYVGKRIRLLGEDRNSTIIDGQNKGPFHHITITHPGVEITNFTIQNSMDKHGGIVLYSSNNTIRGNIIRKNGIGMGLNSKSSNNTICENLFMENHLFGLGLDELTQRNNRIEQNVFQENTIGLYLMNTYNIIKNNQFYDDGIYPSFSSGPLVAEILNNTVNGKPLVCYTNISGFTITEAGAIILFGCRNGVIDQTIISETDRGIYLMYSSNITISDCVITSTSVGITLVSSENITLSHNQISQSTWLSVGLYESRKNQLLQNIMTDSNDGMYFYSSSDNIVEHNNISSTIVGISCWSSSKNNRILQNNFFHNQQHAFDACDNQWIGNYWDDWSGLGLTMLRFLPYHIPGRVLRNFDCSPAQNPYIITN
jgi:parallel beta-helix repeat protein